jgi:hypothetical protein
MRLCPDNADYEISKPSAVAASQVFHVSGIQLPE